MPETEALTLVLGWRSADLVSKWSALFGLNFWRKLSRRFLAVALSPILAVFVQRLIDIEREHRGAKLAVFKDLMGTRRFALSQYTFKR